MTKEEEQLAEEMQESHREASGKEGLIREFLRTSDSSKTGIP